MARSDRQVRRAEAAVVTRLPLHLAVVHDADESTATLVVCAGETDVPIERVQLRPEHNNPVDAVKILANFRERESHGYELEGII